MASTLQAGLQRLTNDLWCIRQTRFDTIYRLQGTQDFRIAQVAQRALQNYNLAGPLHVNVTNNGALNGRWKITPVREGEGMMHRIKQFIPYTFEYPVPANTCVVEIKKDDPSWRSGFRWDFWNAAPVVPSVSIAEALAEPTFNLDCAEWLESTQTQLRTDSYGDPFSTLAAQCLQTVEKDYVSEVEIRGQHYFSLDTHKRLSLLSWDPTRPLQGELLENMNRATRAYREHIRREFGDDHMDYFQYEFGFNFEEMATQNHPLFPDHVYKSNVGANSIEMSHIANLYEALCLFESSTEEECHLPYRELRALMRAWNLTSVSNLKSFIRQHLRDQDPEYVEDLSPETSHFLISLLLPQDDATWERLFTGREITHTPIVGFKTLGNPKQRDPSRSLAEFLNTFRDLANSTGLREQSELLSHVVVKKETFRASEDGTWRVGSIFPLGKDVNGTPIYYVVKALIDDDHGDVNYFCAPISNFTDLENGKALPVIKLYRSTASDSGNMNFWDSIAADLNYKYGGPSSTAPELGDDRETPYFLKCTIPVWVGYLLAGDRAKTVMEKHACYVNAWSACHPDDVIDTALSTEDLRESLYSLAEEQQELPKYKTKQDIHFVGHSLGASLAQFGTYYFGPRLNRIPLPECHSLTYAGDAPGIDNDTDALFFNFGRQHRQMLATLGIKYDIRYDFEYRDVVSQGGECHLGTSRYQEDDKDWLILDIHVNRAVDNPSAAEVRLLPTHGRRFGKDDNPMTSHTVIHLTPAQLNEFGASWSLSPELRRIFGFSVITSPAGTELARKALAQIRRPIGGVLQRFYEWRHPPIGNRDGDGVFFVKCDSPHLEKGLVNQTESAA